MVRVRVKVKVKVRVRVMVMVRVRVKVKVRVKVMVRVKVKMTLYYIFNKSVLLFHNNRPINIPETDINYGRILELIKEDKPNIAASIILSVEAQKKIQELLRIT